MVPVDALTPHECGVNEGDLGAIIESVGANRFYGAILAQKSSGKIIAGKHRWIAAKDKGLVLVPVIWADVDDAAALRIMLADNRTARLGTDNQADLAQLLQDILSDAGTLTGTGYDGDFLDELLTDLGINGQQEPEQPKFEPDIVKTGSLSDLTPTDEERAVLAGRKLLIEYSGGKDSTAAALWCRQYFPDNPTELLFVCLGSDYIGFHTYLHDASKYIGAPLKVLRSSRTVLDVIMEHGEWPSFSHPYCHDVLHEPLDAYVSSHSPDDITIMRGGRMAEKARRSKAKENRWLTIDRLPEYRYFQPLYFSDKGTSESVLAETSCPIWEGYRCGLQRTACRICPGQRTVSYAAIRTNYPEVWAELLWMQDKLGPGCWSDIDNEGRGTFEENADRGQKKFAEGSYPRPPTRSV